MELPEDSKESWKQLLKVEFEKPNYKELLNFVSEERQKYKDAVYPPAHQVFEWTRFCEVNEVKVVIVGQDPYPNPNEAHGLAFSVPYGVAPPPSLLNIYKELKNDIGFENPGHGNLEFWAKQGVLLLNVYMTFRQHLEKKKTNVHQHRSWKIFTNSVLSHLFTKEIGIVFMLWGDEAKGMDVFKDVFMDPARLEQIKEKCKHDILTASHPSPYSAHISFFGCKHFSKCNQHLETEKKFTGKKEVTWQLPQA